MHSPPPHSLETMFGLKGRVALVTGASRGLGLSMAFGLAAAGAHVLVNSRSAADVAIAADAICERRAAASPLPFDVEQAAARETAFAQIEKQFGRLDILVSNVGVRHRAPIAEITETDFNHVISNHVTAGLMLAKSAAPLMRRGGYGRIILISSIGAIQARAGDVAYHAAKGAVSSLTRALACEFGSYGITCNAIAPGLFATQPNRELVAQPAVAEALRTSTALRRCGDEQEIAGAAVFLASPAASYVTGHVLTVDGGWTIHV